jgi:hypothetical protein
MNINKILKVKFLNIGEYDGFRTNNGVDFLTILPQPQLNNHISPFASGQDMIIEDDIEFDDLVNLMSKIEKERNGLGSAIHKEAFTGIDYLGYQVKFSSYAVWQEYITPENEDRFWQNSNYQIFKFNFNPDWIPLNKEILRRSRENKLNQIL